MEGKKTGGRVAGTPNKVTKVIKDCISDVLSGYMNSEDFKNDFNSLKPRDRLAIAEKLMSYTVPKLQATALDINSTKNRTIEDRLLELSEEEEEEEE